MALFAEEFGGWLEADFEAFAAAKWKSNRFTPERTKVRLRLTAALEAAARGAGVSPDGLQLWSSRQEPAFSNQHEVRELTVAWTRSGAEDVENAHIYAGVAVDHAAVTLRVRLPQEQAAAWHPVRATLAELAEVAGMRVRVAGVDVVAGGLADAGPGDLVLERAVPRADAIGGLLTVDELTAWVSVVLPLVAQLLGVTLGAAAPIERVPEPEPEPATQLELPAAPEPEATAPGPAPIGPGIQRDPPARRGYRPQWAPQAASPQAARPVDAVRPPVERIMPPTWRPEPIHRPPPPPPYPRAGGRNFDDRPRHVEDTRRPDRAPPPRAPGRPFELGPSPQKPVASSGVLAPGARVELQKGLFAGKAGTISELAGSHAQVLLGLMSVRVPVADLRAL